MEWTADVAAGDWIRDRIDPASRTIRAVVPAGFEAYARIFHPPFRDRPVGRAWPEAGDRAAWDAFEGVEIDGELTTWATAAHAFGTRMHPLAQWQTLIPADAPRRGGDPGDPCDADGWRYGAPATGRLEPELLAAAARHLVAHTSTPDAGFAALWEGWGGVLGGMTEGTARAALAFASDGLDPHVAERHREMLGRSVRDRFNRVFRKPTWQPGVLSDEISRGPRLELPGRGHVLFRAAPAEFARPDWQDLAPWIEPGGASDESPSLIWPEDRSWLLATEVDHDSTIVAGTTELVRDLCADPHLEAHAIPSDADLTARGDAAGR
ncbi:hypothetical protein [Microbacterium album]|uniref:Uncharacterized protein n=1 Tax=Microbacterium album TaxID=2053191 RepID=A0A917IIF2_9MICO|nr:hypothetical protein [Microbacterium album]GGH51398.1 hypothetical protein GCM10010921_30780 [Microbacterium album]